MQSSITLESDILKDNYTEYVSKKFDLDGISKVTTMIPLPDIEELKTFNWNIGLIIGNSGSGKSTILNKIGTVAAPYYDETKAVISQFQNLGEEDAALLLQGVGIASVPTWLKKPHELSNGEKSRLDLAWSINNNPEGQPILIDEYTSVVNRLAAASMSNALQKLIRRQNLQIILASCHFDILPWLRPDWVFNLNKTKDGAVAIERLVYSDSAEYSLYPQINENDQLTEKLFIDGNS